jgi:outer membrane receptor protein involved in Fe transport
VTYGWSSVRDEISGRAEHRSWDQTHSVSAGVSHGGPRWQASVVASWRSGWPTTAIELATLEPFPLVATGPRNSERLGTYARLDARVARRFTYASGQTLTVFLDVSNLADRRNDCCVEYQLETEEGSPFLDVGTRETLPLVPSVGFVWEF